MKKLLFSLIFIMFILLPTGRVHASMEPQNLKAVPAKDDNTMYIYLEWDQEPSELGYIVTKQEGNGPEEEIYDLELGDDPDLSEGGYIVDKVEENKTYTYSVTSIDKSGTESSPTKITVLATACQPEFTIFTGESNDNGVDLTWNSVCDTVEYKLYRDNSLITTTGNTSFTDTSAPDGEHEYKVEAYDTKTSAWSSVLGRAMATKTTEKTIKVTVTGGPKPSTCAAKYNTDFGWVCDLADYISKVIGWIIGIVGGLSLLMMIYAGYIYITSQGNPDRINLAKEIIIGVLAGIVLLFLIGLIVRQIGIV